MPVQAVEAWLDFDDRAWAVSNMKLLHEAGLSATDGHDLYRRLPKDTRQHMAKLVDAGRMAALETVHLHWWAASGLLKAEATPTHTSRGRQQHKVSFTKWVTEARKYINATGGDQFVAALAAAAHLSVAEVADQCERGAVDVDALKVMVALRESVPGL